MARTKTTPAIVKGRSVRLDDGTVLTAGQEDQLKPHLTAASIKALTDRGIIEGTWSPAPTKKEKDEPVTATATGRRAKSGGSTKASGSATPDASDVQRLAEEAERAKTERDPAGDGVGAGDEGGDENGEE
jgi:hypothetical protein